jgi:hypothetical protein
MAILRPRNRLVYFRVSEDEYERFSLLCESHGSRSISELARSAMQTLIKNGAQPEDRIAEKLSMLEAMVSDLNRNVQQISMSLGKPPVYSAERHGGTERASDGKDDTKISG